MENRNHLVISSHPRTQQHHRYSSHIPRTLLNILGPISIIALYAYITRYYLSAPSANSIITKRPIDANVVFYSWWLINAFVLDWARSGIAGFEAAALLLPDFAPKDIWQIMWHTDRAWSAPTGWGRITSFSILYTFHKITRNPIKWTGPSVLWFYLAFSSMLLYVAIPLSGLSMNQAVVLQETGTRVNVLGVNESTFDLRTSNSLVEQIAGAWRQGGTTTPRGASILYAPNGTTDASASYYEDSIQDAYHMLLNNTAAPTNYSITLFSGPEVAERAYGRAWGFQARIACTLVHPYTGLKLLKVASVDDWRSTQIQINSNYNDRRKGATVIWDDQVTLGVNYRYVLTTNDNVSDIGPAYSAYPSKPPRQSLTEVVMWQAYNTTIPDKTFTTLERHPMVFASVTSKDNVLRYLGFAVSCSTESDVGYATLSARTNTFSGFVRKPSSPLSVSGFANTMLEKYPGVMGMASLAHAAMSNTLLGGSGESNCNAIFTTFCNSWAGANATTDGIPRIGERNSDFQLPTISPERMVLAMYRLFGQVAIEVMSTGPGTWKCCAPENSTLSDLGLFGLESANDLVPGIVPYQAVVVLLAVWTLITVIPQLHPFFSRPRSSELLDGLMMFRLGVEWSQVSRELEGTESEGGLKN
ncbi:hypothetical protein NPX13_g739 [Xylaria arbuscula]|uniref:Uncharacterized protein n=1 Tax=Xylaria arbuscula TaxID=114810 RepID=A0A9W8NNV1_9PEZI|nr:hypothetical protein NPX13_g739 [Xylaria arbuscula]